MDKQHASQIMTDTEESKHVSFERIFDIDLIKEIEKVIKDKNLERFAKKSPKDY